MKPGQTQEEYLHLIYGEGSPSMHEHLVRRAAQWLSRRGQPFNCPVVITEMGNGSPEQPDAIGFRTGFSILIECKASRSDFKADSKKHFRRWPHSSMGSYRYMFAPAGLLKADEIPTGWGFLEDHRHRVNIIRKPELFKASDRRYEIDLLCSALRRQIGSGTTGVMCKNYVIKQPPGFQPRATIDIRLLGQDEGMSIDDVGDGQVPIEHADDIPDDIDWDKPMKPKQ